jgi:hypothetical protein
MSVSAARIVVDVVLDDETISEIAMLRAIRLEHYENMLNDPHGALLQLQNAGLKEESSAAQITASAMKKVQQLRQRISEPNLIYEDELTMYVHTLDSNDADHE